MKKLFLAFLLLFALNHLAHALMPEEFAYIPTSSFTDVDTAGNMMFSSAPIRFIGVTISSPGTNNSSLTIYRSTNPAWSKDTSTQVFIATDFLNVNSGPIFVDLFGITNTSYTHINKNGTAKLIIWVQCVKENLKSGQPYWGFCPGLPLSSGERNAQMMRFGD